MTLLLSFLLAAFAFADLPHLDPDFGCISRSEADRYIRDYSIDVESFGGLELCDNSKDTKKLLNDLYLIEKTEFEAPVSHPFIPGFVDRANYYGWMKTQTRGVDRGHDIPYATAYNSGGYFTMQDGWAVLSTLGRVGTIIHEARHTAGYRHYRCNSGPYADSSVAGCDTTFSQGGSHGVEMEYYARVVLEAKNLHPVYQSMARLMALGRSNFVFNEQPMKKREALAALSGEKLFLVDGQKIVERLAPEVEAGSRLKRTSFGASLFDGKRATALDLYGISNGVRGDDYSYFKLFNLPRDGFPNGIKSVEEVDFQNRRYLVALTEDSRVFTYNFPEGEWHSPTAPLAGAADFVTVSPSGKAGLFVVRTDGSLVPFDLRSRRFGNALAERWPADVSSFGMLRGKLVALKSAGRIVDGAGIELPELSGQSFTDMVNVPLYDAFEVAP